MKLKFNDKSHKEMRVKLGKGFYLYIRFSIDIKGKQLILRILTLEDKKGNYTDYIVAKHKYMSFGKIGDIKEFSSKDD